MLHTTKLVILGRDGILNHYREGHVTAPEEWLPIPGALEAVARINHAGWHTVVATNQAGIGRGMIDMSAVNAVHAHMNQQLMVQGGRIDAVFFCPHTPDEDCACRKPKPGMMLEIGRRYGIALEHVPMVADTLRDLQAARSAGCQPHLVLSGRSQGLQGDALQQLLAQVPGAHVHHHLNAFADFLLQRDHIVDSSTGSLA
ncbi:MAG TPA: D-glycero-beta-D-manno-heptose 1,7-bisphosphate 7-phosphatase [Rubrivivax sp.]|nr:D-glycero-beta-D-manno-heptose 1,7-bisphosphate 7-phosphatase [Rubrivivax sp.]